MFACDLDGVCANTVPALFARVSAELGCSQPALDSLKDYRVEQAFPEEYRERAKAAIREIYAGSEVYAEGLPFPGAAETLNWFARRGLLKAYITRRPAISQRISETWLEAHGFPKLPVIGVGEKATKSEAMTRVGARILIEDSLSEVLEVEGAGLNAVLLDRSYNRELPEGCCPRAPRFLDWYALWDHYRVLPLDYRERRDPLGWPEKKKRGAFREG